jgi:hypothetical protein
MPRELWNLDNTLAHFAAEKLAAFANIGDFAGTPVGYTAEQWHDELLATASALTRYASRGWGPEPADPPVPPAFALRPHAEDPEDEECLTKDTAAAWHWIAEHHHQLWC